MGRMNNENERAKRNNPHEENCMDFNRILKVQNTLSVVMYPPATGFGLGVRKINPLRMNISKKKE